MGINKSLYDEIVRVAHDLYEKRGRIHGYHLEDWLEAEEIVLKRHAKEIEQEANTIGSTKGEEGIRQNRSQNIEDF